MSSILDALKKLEEEKAAKQASASLAPVEEEVVDSVDLIEGLRQSKSQPAEGIHLSPKWILGGGLALVVILVGVSAMVSLAVVRTNTANGGTSQQLAAAPTPAPVETPAPAPTAPPAATAPPRETPLAAVEAPPNTETTASTAVAETPSPPATPVAVVVTEPTPEPAPEASEAPAPSPVEQPVQVAAVLAAPSNPTPENAPMPVPAPAPAPVAAPAPAPEAPTAVAASVPAEPEPVPPPAAPAPQETTVAPVETLPVKTDPGPVNLRELPLLRNAERVQYGLEDLRLNMIREATPQRPEAMAIINLNKVYVGEMVPSTGARLIAVERHGVGIEVGGKRFYLQH